MANRRLATQQPASFAFTADNLAWIEKLIARLQAHAGLSFAVEA